MPRAITATAAGVLTAGALAGCGAGSAIHDAVAAAKSAAATQPVATTAGAAANAGGGGGEGSVSQVSVRVANFFSNASKTGVGIDLYDVDLRTDAAAKPIITDLAYGAVSDYVHPHTKGAGIVSLYALPTGSPTSDTADEQMAFQLQDPGSLPQPLSGLSFSEFVEKGDDQGRKAPLAPPPPSGDGEVLALTAPVDALNLHPAGGYFLFVDDSCDSPLNSGGVEPGVPYIFAADTGDSPTPFAMFPATAGSHQVSLVIWDSGVSPKCTDLTAKQDTQQVDLTAGEQTIAFVYGTSLTDVHMVLAPVAS